MKIATLVLSFSILLLNSCERLEQRKAEKESLKGIEASWKLDFNGSNTNQFSEVNKLGQIAVSFSKCSGTTACSSFITLGSNDPIEVPYNISFQGTGEAVLSFSQNKFENDELKSFFNQWIILDISKNNMSVELGFPFQGEKYLLFLNRLD